MNCGCDLSKAFTKIVQEVRCERCDGLLYTREVHRKGDNRVKLAGPCHDCKQESRSRVSAAYQREGNPNWKGGTWADRTYLSPSELSAFFSQRMKEANPMARPDVRQRVSETLRERYESGEIVRKRGPEHPLWRGNREPLFVVRTRLRLWIHRVMRRDRWQCTRCEAKGTLEVHHQGRTFQNFVEETMGEFGWSTLADKDVSSPVFQRFADRIVEKHSLADGQTYCPPCHADVDEQRRVG